MSEINTSTLFNSLYGVNNNNLTEAFSKLTDSSDNDSEFSFEMSLLQMLKASEPAYNKISELMSNKASASQQTASEAGADINDGSDGISEVNTSDSKQTSASDILNAFGQLSSTGRTIPTTTTELLFAILNGDDTDKLLNYSNLSGDNEGKTMNSGSISSAVEQMSSGSSSEKLQTYMELMSALSKHKLI